MSDFVVTLVLKTFIYSSKLLGFQDCVSLELEHYDPNTNFIDRLYLKTSFLNPQKYGILYES